MASNYRKFVRLASKWPDTSDKAGLQFGQYLKERVSETFKQGDATSINEKECAATYKHLEDLLSNAYKQQYKRKLLSSATGFPAAICKQVLTPEGLSMIKHDHEGFWKRMKNRLYSSW